MPEDLTGRLAERAAQEGLAIGEELRVRLALYLDVLRHWNRKINLTALSNLDEAIDRLLLEPIAAARYLRHSARLADLGSGGGSPAIPLALATSATELLMIESRSRKCAFLREAIREVGLHAVVECARFESATLQAKYFESFDVISIRAVRSDQPALTSAYALLAPDGVIAVFRGPDGPERVDAPTLNLAWRETRPLLGSTRSRLTILFHVERPEAATRFEDPSGPS